MMSYYPSDSVCYVSENMLLDPDAEVTSSINDQGSLIVSSTFAEVLANTEVSIRVKILNPNNEVTCPENSLDVF